MTRHIAPSDFHQFGPLQEFTRGTKFTSDEKIKTLCTIGLGQSKEFYREGKQKLVHRWQKCVVVQGDYVEK